MVRIAYLASKLEDGKAPPKGNLASRDLLLHVMETVKRVHCSKWVDLFFNEAQKAGGMVTNFKTETPPKGYNDLCLTIEAAVAARLKKVQAELKSELDKAPFNDTARVAELSEAISNFQSIEKKVQSKNRQNTKSSMWSRLTKKPAVFVAFLSSLWGTLIHSFYCY